MASDGRKVIRAKEGFDYKGYRPFGAMFEAEDRRKLHDLALEMNTSMAEALRFCIRFTHKGTINS